MKEWFKAVAAGSLVFFLVFSVALTIAHLLMVGT